MSDIVTFIGLLFVQFILWATLMLELDEIKRRLKNLESKIERKEP